MPLEMLIELLMKNRYDLKLENRKGKVITFSCKEIASHLRKIETLEKELEVHKKALDLMAYDACFCCPDMEVEEYIAKARKELAQ